MCVCVCVCVKRLIFDCIMFNNFHKEKLNNNKPIERKLSTPLPVRYEVACAVILSLETTR